MLDWDEVTKVRKLASAFNGAADGGGAVGNAVATDETLDSLDANDEPPAAAAAVAVVATDSSAAPSSSSATTTSAGIGSKFAAAKKRDRLGERKRKKKIVVDATQLLTFHPIFLLQRTRSQWTQTQHCGWSCGVETLVCCAN